jgi:hypothetical protein
MFIQNFSSLACTQTDLDKFLTIFDENSRTFHENSKANSKKIQIWVYNFLLNLAKHVYAKCQLSTLYPDGLRHIFDNFWRKFQDFSGKLFSEFWKPDYAILYLTLQTMFMQNFSSLASNQTDLDTFLKKISGFFRKTL